jgi:putative two-component system response regulator
MLIMAASIAASHHERWDGTGYPKRISGENIPLEARITAVADVFDALSTSRCYKPAFPLQECFEIVASERGRHFDPQVVDACFAARDQFEATYRSLADTDAAS